MRINKYVALATALSRRAADTAIAQGRVTINGNSAVPGLDVTDSDVIELDDKRLIAPQKSTTIIFNKPVGYVVSRDGQGSPTIYDLLPPQYHDLNPVGRLDKDSSGLLVLTNNGSWANQLAHPRHAKWKIYKVLLDKSLSDIDANKIRHGLKLADGVSSLRLIGRDKKWTVKMAEGRNRQIRRTFAALGYTVTDLHRETFGYYTLGKLKEGQSAEVSTINSL